MANREDHLYTPQFAEASKTHPRPFQRRLDQQCESLGTIDSSLDLVPHLETKDKTSKRQPPKTDKRGSDVTSKRQIRSEEDRVSDVSARLREQRELAATTLRRAAENFSHSFRTPLKEYSTVNESDVTDDRLSGMSGFGSKVRVASTPRASAMRDSLDAELREAERESRRQSEMFDELIRKMKTSDITISEVCREFREKMGAPSISNIPELDSNFFTPAELAVEKLKADELSWQKEKDIPAQRLSDFSLRSDNTFNKISIGEFFREKSDDIRKVIPNKSPEKTSDPVPLIDSFSNVSVPQIKESLSVTEIAKLLSEMSDDNPSKMISCLLKQKSGSKENITMNKENISPSKPTKLTTSYKTSLSPSSPQKSQTLSLNSTVLSKSSSDGESSAQLRQLEKSSSTLRSGSALSNLPEGKLPLETTRSQLIWGCVRLGKSVTQEFVLRNRSQHRLRVQITSNVVEFRILKDRNEGEGSNVLKMMIRPLESRTILVSFSPSAIGAYAATLSFTPIDSDLNQSKKQMIFLYGCGGHASVECCDIVKDPNGKFLLPLGNLTSQVSVTKSVICRNVGVVSGFVFACFESKSVCHFSSLSIEPNKFVLKPQQELRMNVSYTVGKDDLKYFHGSSMSDIIEIGMIKLYTGAEALRGRLKYLKNKAVANNLQVKPIVEELTDTFENEDIPKDVSKLKESVEGMKYLLQEITPREIVLIVERDLEATIVPNDDTSVFQTLCQDFSNITVIETHSKFKIEPASIILTPPIKTEDALLLINEKRSEVFFEAFVKLADVVKVKPSSGIVLPGETAVIKIVCKEGGKKSERCKVVIRADDEESEVDVKIVSVLNNAFKY